jgi:ferredoxin-type protein NapF
MNHPVDNARRNLLRGLPAMTSSPVRPPGAICEPEFADGCTACNKCISACPEDIIISGSGGYPEVDFHRGECTFCCECVSACPEPVLDSEIQPLWQLRLRVEDRCLAKRSVICQTCADVCDQQAIRFRPLINILATPEINYQNCNGCGACISACPEDALVLETTMAVTVREGVALHG